MSEQELQKKTRKRKHKAKLSIKETEEPVKLKKKKKKGKENNIDKETEKMLGEVVSEAKEQVKIKKKKKKETKETESSDMDTDTENTIADNREAKIKNVKKLKSELLETVTREGMHEKRTDTEDTEKANEIEEMKERKREKRRKKKEALRQQKLAQKKRESGVGIFTFSQNFSLFQYTKHLSFRVNENYIEKLPQMIVTVQKRL